ncbi:MAG: DUF4838 domain-containing protein [Candidatus Nealsonbacteria bacterium]
MKKSLILLTSIISLFILTFPAQAAFPGWDNITTIYYDSSQDDPTNKFLEQAANEIKNNLGQAPVGKILTITTNTSPPAPAIYLSVNASSSDFSTRGDEAFKLYSDADGIYIIGKTPIAVRHGAYTLLEKLGFRWFFKHPAWFITPTSLISLDLDEVQEPWYYWREIGQWPIVDFYTSDKTPNWQARNKLFGAKHYQIGETYGYIIPHSDCSAHPEWFLPDPSGSCPAYPWQLRPDNPDVVAKTKEYVRNLLTAVPHGLLNSKDKLPYGAVSVTPNDGDGWNPPWNGATDWQTITDKVYYLVNEVAKDIKNDFPGALVTVYAYTFYAGIPTINLEPNILSLITTTFNDTPLTLNQQIDGLIAKGVQVGIREYFDIWSWWHDLPMTFLDRINKFTFYAGKGIRVFSAEGGDAWASRGLTYYLSGKMMWNPSSDVNALLADFYDKAFGPAKDVMKRYYDTRGASADAVGKSFLDLAEAESLAVGNPEILERIRQLEYYQRFLWFYHAKGVANLGLDELKSFYTFVTKIRDLYLITYKYDEEAIRTELKKRGLTDADVNILQNFTLPTAAEASAWLTEGLKAFENKVFIVNPNSIQLAALGDTSKPKLAPLYGHYRTVFVSSSGNEDITVLVKGKKGTLQWYGPAGLLINSWSFSTALTNWTPVQFHADLPGTYKLHLTRTTLPGAEYLYVDVPNHPAAILADSGASIFKPNEWLPSNAPTYLGPNEVYFYVPADTSAFIFGASRTNLGRNPSGKLTDSNGVEYPFLYTETTTEERFDQPTPGIWKISINVPIDYDTFWLRGVLPLVWHDPKYLLVEASEIPPPPPIYTPGDLNKDGKVNIFDVSILLSRWGSTNAADLQEADISAGPGNISQSKVDLYDANLMMRNWLP